MKYRGDISPEEYAAMEDGYEQGYEAGRRDQARATISYCVFSLGLIGDNPDPLAVGLAKGYQDIAEKSAAAQR